eukprot:TRINITY_DN13055_c0_g1_i1.p1 TRINITY_DN13055_c0_g1~~TRINITY_DN13055_c0_g1_i1.p1  ORF type:complete len:344 (-),score=95.87 TRINITY_DN13055_c0_g1_i1:225-1256(-)
MAFFARRTILFVFASWKFAADALTLSPAPNPHLLMSKTQESRNEHKTQATLHRNLAFSIRNLDNPERPRMLVMLGCSGSSFLLKMAGKLLEAHGGTAKTPGGEMAAGEIMKPIANPYYSAAKGMAKAMEDANAAAQKEQATLVFKEQGAQSQFFRDAAPTLLKMNTYVVHGYRANALDRMVCQVKDCFLREEYGKPVDKSGEKSDLCFKRRNSRPANGYLASLNTTNLSEHLENFMKAHDEEKERIKAAGFKDFESVSAEDLLDFEHDNSVDAFKRAVKAWKIFLRSWGVKPSLKVIRDELQQYSGAYKAELQSDTIYNFQEVSDIVRGNAKLQSLLRVRDEK